jgi:hypothetical protein
MVGTFSLKFPEMGIDFRWLLNCFEHSEEQHSTCRSIKSRDGKSSPFGPPIHEFLHIYIYIQT